MSSSTIDADTVDFTKSDSWRRHKQTGYAGKPLYARLPCIAPIFKLLTNMADRSLFLSIIVATYEYGSGTAVLMSWCCESSVIFAAIILRSLSSLDFFSLQHTQRNHMSSSGLRLSTTDRSSSFEYYFRIVVRPCFGYFENQGFSRMLVLRTNVPRE